MALLQQKPQELQVVCKSLQNWLYFLSCFRTRVVRSWEPALHSRSTFGTVHTHCFLSPFTLCKAYMLLMYVMRQSSQLQSSRTLVRPCSIQALAALCQPV